MSAAIASKRPLLQAAAVVAAALLVQLVAGGGDEFAGWQQGRATHYGNDGGATLEQGSCMFGHLDANKGTGLDIVALSDKAADYHGSCGRCYEVACRPATVRDGYGDSLDRQGSCKPGARVTVTVTDTCPCWYPSNAFSNKRWCCGDTYHMDLSYTAFAKLGDMGAGVIGIYYRQVPCPPGTPGSSSSSSSSSSSASASSWSSSSSGDDGSDKGDDERDDDSNGDSKDDDGKHGSGSGSGSWSSSSGDSSSSASSSSSSDGSSSSSWASSSSSG